MFCKGFWVLEIIMCSVYLTCFIVRGGLRASASVISCVRICPPLWSVCLGKKNNKKLCETFAQKHI